jgi:hypothetical protein
MGEEIDPLWMIGYSKDFGTDALFELPDTLEESIASNICDD